MNLLTPVIKSIIFDMDRVITGIEHLHCESYLETLKSRHKRFYKRKYA